VHLLAVRDLGIVEEKVECLDVLLRRAEIAIRVCSVSLSETQSCNRYRIGRCSCPMRELCSLIGLALVGAFRSRASLEAENMILRHQLNVLQRKSSKRPTFGTLDRLIFAGLYRLAPEVLGALAIVKPETVIKWHRAGFRSCWRWKSRRRGGRPTVAPEIRKLVREMSIANPLWGVPRIHGELLKIGFDIGQTSVAQYMARRRPAIPRLEDVPSQSCRRHRRDGSVRRTDNLISSALRLVDCGAWSTAHFMVWRHGASDRRMDRKSDHGSLRLGTSSPLSHS
jgi:hypothetical protein